MPWRKIFEDCPPTRDELLKKLFVDRERELQDVLDTYESGQAHHGKVMAVHGETRSGKSHLARRALVALKEKKDPMILVEVNANQQQTADKLLRAVYSDLAEKLLALKLPARASQERKDILEIATARASKVQGLLGASEKELTVEHTSGSVQRLEKGTAATTSAGIKGGILAFIRAHVRGEIERSQTSSREGSQQDRTSYTLATPTPDGLAREIAFLAATLVYLQCNKKRVLLFVDDMDLLSYGPAATEDELDIAGHLATLAAEEPINVIATVRTDLFAKRKSHFGELCEPLGPMTGEELAEVYRRRVQAYAQGREFFTSDALGLLARGAGRLVGDFLAFGYKAYRTLRHDLQTPGPDDVRRYFATRWTYVAQQIPLEAAERIEQRISRGTVEFSGAEIRQEGFEPGASALVAEGVIKPVPYQADQYRIRPIFVEAIRNKASANDR